MKTSFDEGVSDYLVKDLMEQIQCDSRTDRQDKNFIKIKPPREEVALLKCLLPHGVRNCENILLLYLSIVHFVHDKYAFPEQALANPFLKATYFK